MTRDEAVTHADIVESVYDREVRHGATPNVAWRRAERRADDVEDHISNRVVEAADDLMPTWKALLRLRSASLWDATEAERLAPYLDRATSTLDAHLRTLLTAERRADRRHAKGHLDAVVRYALTDERFLRVLDTALDRVGAQRRCR